MHPDPAGFDDLDDAGKVKLVFDALAAQKDTLDRAIAQMSGSSATVEDPDGYAEMTFGDGWV